MIRNSVHFPTNWSQMVNQMPAQSNDFQRLIKAIYEQILPEGGTLTESGQVWDREAQTLREVDILVEFNYAGHGFKYIVECRDRSRWATVEWIDALVGKAKALDGINKVIAVSSKGFTPKAVQKARSHGIETLTLAQANEADWTRFPIRPGVVVLTGESYRIDDVLYPQGDAYVSVATLGIQNLVEFEGQILGDLEGLLVFYFQKIVVPYLNAYRDQHFLEIFKTRADIDLPMRIEVSYRWPACRVIMEDGTTTELREVRYIIFGNRNATDIKQEHRTYNDRMVSTGRHIDIDGSLIASIVVQDPDTEKLHIRVLKSAAK